MKDLKLFLVFSIIFSRSANHSYNYFFYHRIELLSLFSRANISNIFKITEHLHVQCSLFLCNGISVSFYQ